MSELTRRIQAQIKHSMERKSGVPATTAALDIDRPTDLFQKKMRGVFAENVSRIVFLRCGGVATILGIGSIHPFTTR